MKQALTICILLAAIACNAQTEKKGDTLVINNWQAYKFIKIGDKVYRINSPTITEVEQLPTIIRLGSRDWPFVVPAGSGQTEDTLGVQRIKYFKGL